MALYKGSVRLAGLGTVQATRQVTLVANDWSDDSQTVIVDGITETNTVVVSPDPTSYKDYLDSSIYCTAQGDGTLTFVCDDTPTNNIVVNVMFFS